MRVVVLKSRQDARTLKSRLIPETLAPEARVRAEAQLRTANPHLDLDRLEADAVVVVPEAIEVEPAVAERLDIVTPPDLVERLAPVRARLQESIALEAKEREVIRRDLGGRAVRAAIEANPQIAEQVERVRDQLTEDARVAREAEARLQALVEQASTDLEALHQRFG